MGERGNNYLRGKIILEENFAIMYDVRKSMKGIKDGYANQIQSISFSSRSFFLHIFRFKLMQVN